MEQKTVLCVDDELKVLKDLEILLRGKLNSHYRLEYANNAAHAQEIIKDLNNRGQEIVLIISDYLMPEMNGDLFLSQIHVSQPNIMKILLTDRKSCNLSRIEEDSFVYRYISKPWDSDELLLAVEHAMLSYHKDRTIEKQNIVLQQQNSELTAWTEAVVEAMSMTLDTRDTTTSGHSMRMAQFAVKTAEAINHVQYGKYKDFSFDENQIKEIYYAALLHDIGKIGVREQILLKPSRIPMDRQMAIIYRLGWYRSRLQLKQVYEELSESEILLINQIPNYNRFIGEVNCKDYLTEDDIATINEIVAQNYVDEEGSVLPLIDEYEHKNLSVIYGNLTEHERTLIYSHVEYSYNILKGIPWPHIYKNVPEIAASHHEKLDGSGYYRKLKGDAISIQARILGILDIFEALTSSDRPYRKEKKIEEALEILKYEVQIGHLDGDILEVFINEKLYEKL